MQSVAMLQLGLATAQDAGIALRPRLKSQQDRTRWLATDLLDTLLRECPVEMQPLQPFLQELVAPALSAPCHTSVEGEHHKAVGVAQQILARYKAVPQQQSAMATQFLSSRTIRSSAGSVEAHTMRPESMATSTMRSHDSAMSQSGQQAASFSFNLGQAQGASPSDGAAAQPGGGLPVPPPALSQQPPAPHDAHLSPPRPGLLQQTSMPRHAPNAALGMPGNPLAAQERAPQHSRSMPNYHAAAGQTPQLPHQVAPAAPHGGFTLAPPAILAAPPSKVPPTASPFSATHVSAPQASMSPCAANAGPHAGSGAHSSSQNAALAANAGSMHAHGSQHSVGSKPAAVQSYGSVQQASLHAATAPGTKHNPAGNTFNHTAFETVASEFEDPSDPRARLKHELRLLAEQEPPVAFAGRYFLLNESKVGGQALVAFARDARQSCDRQYAIKCDTRSSCAVVNLTPVASSVFKVLAARVASHSW